MKRITMTRPYDMHFHPREAEMLEHVLHCTTDVFVGGVVMGNLPKSIVTAQDAINYRQQILELAPDFNPMMTIMLTMKTTPEILRRAFQAGVRILKYIPGNASTNSGDGIPLEDLHYYYDVLETAQRLGMVFSGHWELPCDENGKEISEMERESRAIPYLKEVVQKFRALRIVVEHATTREMIEYVKSAPANVVATLTVHHAMLTIADVCNVEGEIINPFNYCKPIAKTADDRRAVIEAMVSGNQKFFFGSDSAPHYYWKKNLIPPAAGIFATGEVSMSLLCQLFEREGKLYRLKDFVSVFGPQFYGVPVSDQTLTMVKEDYSSPEFMINVKVFHGGEILKWRVEKN